LIDKKVKIKGKVNIISETKFIELSDSDIIAAEGEANRSKQAL